MSQLYSDSVEDAATCSNFKEVRTTHLHLDLNVNFQEKQISGWLDLALTSQKDGLDLGEWLVTMQDNFILRVNKYTLVN